MWRFPFFFKQTINVNRPKNSIFLDKNKIITINNYNKFIKNIFNSDEGKENKVDILS